MTAENFPFLLVALGVALGFSGCGARAEADDSYCDQIAVRLVGCGVVSEGYFRCEGPQTDLEECGARCVIQASCDDLGVLVCGQGELDGLAACIEVCEPDEAPFRCSDGESIDSGWVCDGEADCEDGGDERECPTFPCPGGGEIPERWQCDGEYDCEGGADERGCPGDEIFTCNNGESFPEAFRCDEDPDCDDGSDELGCAERQCG